MSRAVLVRSRRALARRILIAVALLTGATVLAQAQAKPTPKPTPTQVTTPKPTPTTKPAVPPPAARGAAGLGMTATVQIGSTSPALAPVMTRVMPIAEKVDSARAAALAMPVGQGALLPTSPGATVTYVWVIDLAKVTGLRTVSGSPVFTVRYRDAPGVSPEDVSPAIVQLIGSAAGPRVMSALRGRVDQTTRRQADWDLNRDLKQDIVASNVELTARGVAKITPAAPLPSGQYAIVMRPTGNKKFSGASVLSEAEEGRLFGMAWVFIAK